MSKVMVDTNVWVELELRTESCANIVELMRKANERGIRVGITAHSLKDVFEIVQRRLKQMERADPRMDERASGPSARAVSWAIVQHIMERAEVVGSDYMDAYLAVKERVFHDFYEDNLVVAAARRMGADLLVTNDKALLKHASVAALPVERAIEWIEAYT